MTTWSLYPSGDLYPSSNLYPGRGLSSMTPGVTWENWPSKTSPISAEVLNELEDAIKQGFPLFVQRKWIAADTYDAIQDHVLNFVDTVQQPSLYPSKTLYPGMVGGPYPGMPLHILDVSPTDLYPVELTTKLTAVAMNDLEARLAAVIPGFTPKTWVNWPSTSTPMDAAAMTDLFARALDPTPPPPPPVVANLSATLSGQGGMSGVLSTLGPFQPLFAVAGGPGRNNQAAFQYTKLPTTVGIDTTIDQVAFQTELNAKAQVSRWINYQDFTTKRVVVPDTQPLEPVLLYRGNWGGGFTGTNYPSWALTMDKICRAGFPVPPSYVPDAGTDKELVLLQPTYQYPSWATLPVPLVGRMFEGWIFEKNPAYDPLQPKVWPNYIWRCGWPARACGLNIWPGHFLLWNSTNPQTWWPYTGVDGANPSNPNGTYQESGEGASASGIALADSEMLVEDLNRNINGGKWGLGHCIGLSVPTVGGFRWPAQRSDASSPSTYPIKYGMRLCLPANYVIPSGIHPVCRALIQNCILSDDPNKPGYGFVVHEQTNSSVVIKAQPGAQTYWSGVSPSDVLTPFPWNQLQVIATGSDGAPVPAAVPPTVPANTDTPVIGGTVAQNATLGLYKGTWSGSLPITYAYQWQWRTLLGTTFFDIIGGTGAAYIPVSTDVGNVLRGKVTATNAAGSTIEYSDVTSEVVARPAPFMRDSFTGTNSTSIVLRAGEIGAIWTKHTAGSTATTDDTIQTNRAMGPVGSGTNVYYASATPPTADYDVTVLLNQLSDNNSSHVSAAGRMSTTLNSMYFVQSYTGNSLTSMHRLDNGVVTELDTVPLIAKSSITLRMVGDQISGLVDGVVVLGPVTDVTFTTAGKAGFRHGGLNSTTTGIHLENIEAANLTSVPPSSAPTNDSVPVIGGRTAQDQTVGLHAGTWSGPGPMTFTYQWQRSADGITWADISGQTAILHLIVAADVGNVLRVAVTATNANGTTTAYSLATITVLTGPAPFVRDSFTGTNGVTVESRAGETGATWTKHASSTGNTSDVIQSNRAMGPTATGVNIYYASAVPPTADYDVTGLIAELADNDSSYLSVAGRVSTTLNTMYFVRYDSLANACTLNVINNGVSTVLATSATIPKVSLTLRMVGNQISGVIDNAVVLGPVTDATISTAGRGGFRHGPLNSTTAGVHLENVEVVEIVASGLITTSALSSVSMASPSGTGNITMTFNAAYQVGQFPNGDYFVLTSGGNVVVTAMTPTYATGRHGWAVNPKATVWNVGNSFDDRGSSDSAFSTPPALPLTLTANQSLIKVASMTTQTSYSWINHAAVLTVLTTAPPIGTMRPAAFGTAKRQIPSAPIDGTMFPNIAAATVPDRLTYAQCIARCEAFRNDYHPGSSWGYYRSSAAAVPGGLTWGGDVLKADIELLATLCLDHLTAAEKKAIAIRYAQHGIDTWGVAVPATGGGAGFLRGGGANGAGHLLSVVFAAWATGDTAIQSWIDGASEATWNPVGGAAIGAAELMFWETASFYRSTITSQALWGKRWETWIGDGEHQYWTDFNVPAGLGVSNATLRDPYERIDGGPIPGGSYQDTVSHQMMGLANLMSLIPSFQAAWPTLVANDAVLLEYGRRWQISGIRTSPDPVAPKTAGGVYGTNYGPTTLAGGGPAGYDGTGVSGYRAGAGRAISLNNTGAGGGNRFSQLTADFSAQALLQAGGVAPSNTATPVIGGIKTQGQTIGLWPGTWTGTAPITYTYKWQRSANSGSTWSDIGSATGLTYLVQAADVGDVLRAVVTATNAAGIAVTNSAMTSVVLTSSSSTIFSKDSFTGTNGVTVQSRAGETGATWTLHPSSTATAGDNDTIQSNRAMGPTGATGTNIYYTSAVPSSDDYDVTVLINELADNNASHMTAAGRMSTTANTMYGFQYLSATNTFNLILLNAGTLTTLATATGVPRAAMTLRMIGNQISGIADGAVVLGPVANGTLTSGRAGYRHGAPNTTSAGVHFEHFEAASYVAAPGPIGNIIWKADGEQNIQFEWAEVNDLGVNGSQATTTNSTTEANLTRISRSTFSAVGTRSYKFTIVNTDRDFYNQTTRQRTEVGQGNPIKNMPDGVDRLFYEGQDRWISFQIYLPTNFALDQSSNTVVQWKQIATSAGVFGNPVKVMDGSANQWRLFHATDITPANGGLITGFPAIKNVWAKHTFHFFFSPNPAVGFIEWYADNGDGAGMRTVLPRYFTYTMKRDGSSNGNPTGPGSPIPSHVRAGIYRNIYNITSDVYIDGYTVATTRAAAEASAFGTSVVVPPVDLTNPTTLANTYTTIEAALVRTDTALTDGTQYPNYTTGGVWTPTTNSASWNSGFLPGQFWKTFERTAATTWRDRAISWQTAIDTTPATTHDIGLQYMTTFVKGYQQLGTVAYKTAALAAATTLNNLWNAAAGVFNCQPFFTTPNTIIDSALAVELLYWAADNGHASAATLRTRATAHLLKLITAHVRGDGGTFQVTQYNPSTGAVVDHPLSQGYQISSTWSRGQAWGITGLVRAYRYIHVSDPTNAATLLAGAVAMATYFVDNLPADGVPLWDFDAPDLVKDSSAAAIAASGLLELDGYDSSRNWHAAGIALLNRLASAAYLAAPAESYAILKHGTSNKNAPVGVDEGLSYGDMYFIEALSQL